MAPVKRRPHTRSHHKMKLRRHKPNISKLVYKFLSLGGGKEGRRKESRGCDTGRCRFCKRQKRGEEVLDSLDSRIHENMANKRKDSARNSKIHRVKRRQTPRDQTLSSCMHRSNGGEGLRKMKKYIQKALDFGVESGYLIPKDATYKVLRVSSDLMADVHYANKLRKSDSTVSQARDKSSRQTPLRFEEYEVQDARRRRRGGRRRSRRHRRSRSGSRRRRRRSRRRGRRRSGSATGEEVIDVENDNEFEYETQPEKRNNTENANRSETDNQLNQSDKEKEAEKREDDASDLSMDEDESDDEEGKKGEDENKS